MNSQISQHTDQIKRLCELNQVKSLFDDMGI